VFWVEGGVWAGWGGIPVQEEKDARGSREPVDLIFEELSSKERYHIGNACLSQAHGSPGTFDDNDAFVAETLCPVGIVKDVGLGEVLGESPLAETCNLRGSKQSGAISEGTSLNVVQAYGCGVFEEGGASSGACLEESGGNGRNLFDGLEKVRFRIEENGASEGFKGGAVRSPVWSPDYMRR
jgi:hypothetical protein